MRERARDLSSWLQRYDSFSRAVYRFLLCAMEYVLVIPLLLRSRCRVGCGSHLLVRLVLFDLGLWLDLRNLLCGGLDLLRMRE